LLQDGVPARIHRRVTLVRTGQSTGEEEQRLPSAQAEGSGREAPVTPKKKKAKAEGQDSQQQGAKELRMEDIIVKVVASCMHCQTVSQPKTEAFCNIPQQTEQHAILEQLDIGSDPSWPTWLVMVWSVTGL